MKIIQTYELPTYDITGYVLGVARGTQVLSVVLNGEDCPELVVLEDNGEPRTETIYLAARAGDSPVPEEYKPETTWQYIGSLRSAGSLIHYFKLVVA